MKHPFLAGGVALAAALNLAPALALGRLADVSVVDRDTGEVLTAHPHRGDFFVEGRPGARYSIRIRNAQGRRVLAVTSVDGINVVTGESAAPDQRGYVFDPWASYDIAGWRKSDAQIAAFEFTAVPRSYAARTGRADNVGVIGVALFREQQQRPVAPAPKLEAPADRYREQAANSRSLDPARAPSLGTGHGAREASVVTQVAFERARIEPDEVIRVRYDSHANLVALGVIRDAPAPRRPDPFPGAGYVPDP
jgi:hypothetical protein